MMSLKERKELIKLGQLVIGMIRDVFALPEYDIAHAIRQITVPGGEHVTIYIVRDDPLRDYINKCIDSKYDTSNITLPGIKKDE